MAGSLFFAKNIYLYMVLNSEILYNVYLQYNSIKEYFPPKFVELCLQNIKLPGKHYRDVKY